LSIISEITPIDCETFFEQINVIRNSKYYNPELFAEIEALYSFYKQGRIKIYYDTVWKEEMQLLKGRNIKISDIPLNEPNKVKIDRIQNELVFIASKLGMLLREN